jgi:hypothetical protein
MGMSQKIAPSHTRVFTLGHVVVLDGKSRMLDSTTSSINIHVCV